MQKNKDLKPNKSMSNGLLEWTPKSTTGDDLVDRRFPLTLNLILRGHSDDTQGEKLVLMATDADPTMTYRRAPSCIIIAIFVCCFFHSCQATVLVRLVCLGVSLMTKLLREW